MAGAQPPPPGEAEVSRGVLLAVISALLGLLGQLAWRAAVPRGGALSLAWLIRVMTDKLVLLGVLLYALSTLVWLAALRLEELSRLYPLISLNYALTLLAGHVLFGEQLTPVKVLGVALIMAGVSLIALAH